LFSRVPACVYRFLKVKLIKSFSGGPGGRFFKKAPLAAGGNNMIEATLAHVKKHAYKIILVAVPVLIWIFFISTCKVRTEPEKVWHLRNKIVTLTESLVGLPYKFGGKEIGGFDCSGLVCYVFDCYGIALPRTAGKQAKMKEKIKLRHAKPADILAFKIKRRWHTGIYVGKQSFIHAPGRGEAIRKERLTDFWKKRLKYVIRVIHD
jgi:hypothetical protein